MRFLIGLRHLEVTPVLGAGARTLRHSKKEAAAQRTPPLRHFKSSVGWMRHMALKESRQWLSLGLVAPLVFVCSCRQSLFDAHIEGGTAGDAPPAQVCPAPCIGDSGADFDGSATGTTGRWRYLADHRNRTWSPMTAIDGGFVGANPENTIRSCAANPSATACRALPGALLVSTAGVSSPADPAIEFTAGANQTIDLRLSVHVPDGGLGQTVQIYRNSREDALFTGSAQPHVTLNHVVRLDALASDRFLVALSSPAAGQPDIAVQLHVVDSLVTFPAECQFAISFSALSGGTTESACRPNQLVASHDSTPGTPAPALEMGPYPELGQAAKVAEHNYYNAAAVLDRPGDVTLDLWVKHATLPSGITAYIFSERNLHAPGGGGLFARLVNIQGELRLNAGTVYTSPGVVNSAHVEFMYPPDQRWHFLRVVHEVDGLLRVCFDGTLKGATLAPGTLKPNNPPFIGQDAHSLVLPATFVGSIDDVRVLNTALPCN